MKRRRSTGTPPALRARRLRRSGAIRSLVRETRLAPADFILPLFIAHGKRLQRPVPSMPGVFQWSLDNALREVETAAKLGVNAVLLFGLPKSKDALGSEAYARNGVIQLATRAIKQRFPETVVFTDLCFCEYTDHGHCGVLTRVSGELSVDNDATLDLLRKTAVAQAEAGADFVAPSGMMDGAVAAIRGALDRAGFGDTGILAYAAKYASVFYGPFRDAAGSAPSQGDRRTYQMDPANGREGLKEIFQDVAEGADMVMVKPALAYLDVMARARPLLKVPLVAYNVSGEYAMVKAAEKNGWLSGAREERAALEILTSIKRAGAELIITYHALDAARVLRRPA